MTRVTITIEPKPGKRPSAFDLGNTLHDLAWRILNASEREKLSEADGVRVEGGKMVAEVRVRGGVA